MVIAENGLGAPKVDLKTLMVENADNENSLNKVGYCKKTGYPQTNVRFALMYNDNQSPYYAAGSCQFTPSFFHKIKMRMSDPKYNIEQGFYAAMSMLDKKIEFNYIPLTRLKIGEKDLYFVGERGHPFNEVLYKGDLDSGKWVAFFVFKDEIVGFVTCGYVNLHLYMWEAMKNLIMPTAAMLRAHDVNFEHIVDGVLKNRHDIKAKRKQVLAIPSVMKAEFTREID